MSKNWDISKSRCYNLTVTEICSNDSGRKQQKDKRTAHQTFYRISVALDQAFFAKCYYQSKFTLFQISGGAAVDEIDKSCKHLKECYKCAKQERS
jgi:cobyrinic acid a,c-diamide synthase